MKKLSLLSLFVSAGAWASSHMPPEVNMTIYERRDEGFVGVVLRESKAGAIDALITQLGQGENFQEGTPSGDTTIDCRRTLQTGRAICTFGFRASQNVRIGPTYSRWAATANLDRSEMGTIDNVSDIDFDVINRGFDEFKLHIDANGLTAEVLNN